MAPHSLKDVPNPKFRLHLDDLRHPATKSFLSLIPDTLSTLETALQAIIQHLYTSPESRNALPSPARLTEKPLFSSSSFTPSIPPTHSVTVVVRDFEGLAYTTGNEHDKEIHLSLQYIQYRTGSGAADSERELVGILTHELVHCYQHTSPPRGSSSSSTTTENKDGDKLDNKSENTPHPPPGLIEGIADFVRLNADLAPPHWKVPSSAKERPSKWDQGYQHTAYFLDWLERVRVGFGAVGRVNDRLFRVGYVGESLGEDCDSSNNNGDKGEGYHSSKSDSNDDNDNSNGRSRPQEEGFWRGLFGVGVLELWEEYGKYLDGIKRDTNDDNDDDGHEDTGSWKTEFLEL